MRGVGFRKRRLERQSVAASELKLKERKERLRLRREYRKEIAEMVESRGIQLAKAGLTPQTELIERSTDKKEFDTSDQLVTVTTVAYGFGDDEIADDPAPPPASKTSSELLQRAQRAQSSIAALKKAAFKQASAAHPVKQMPKPKRSRKQKGAVPKAPKGKKGKAMKEGKQGKAGKRR